MMIFDEKMTTPDFHRSTNESITGRSDSIRSQRIDTNPCDGNSADHEKGSSDSSYSSTGVEDTNNMFTKFAFPFKLHSILESAGASRQESIISWLPSGTAFKIHKPKEFANAIMPQYFNQTKYRSFQRQLYIYGFDRVKDKTSEDYGAYFHELFIRGASDLCLDMQRKKIKGTGLSNEERRKKATDLRAISKPPSNKNTSEIQIDLTRSSISTTNQMPMLVGSQIPLPQSLLYTGLGLNPISAQLQQLSQQQQQTTGKSNISDEWNSENAAAVIKSAFQVQAFATRQDNLDTIQSNVNNTSNVTLLSQYETMVLAGRRPSLGFLQGMGRRGSLLYDGDEVCFGDRKFHFTSDY